MVARFTKYGHSIGLNHPFTTLKVAKVFVDNVHKLHGSPKIIVTDRDKILLISSGKNSWLNQCLEAYLRSMTHKSPKQCAKWLRLAEWWYNTTHHSSLKMSPFQALYGFPPHFMDTLDIDTPSAQLEDFMEERQMISRMLKPQLLEAQNWVKQFADKNRTKQEFVGKEFALLKLQPYKQTSMLSTSI